MVTFVAAYVVVWLAVVLYAARLDARQRQLQRDLETLQSQVDRSESPQQPTSQAA